jgi:transposase-like protein
MNKTDKIEVTPLEKEAIVAEYLMSKVTYRQLAEKYDVDFRIIHSWVMKFQGTTVKKSSPKKEEKVVVKPTPELLALQESLRLEKLRNELLNAIIDIADKDLNTNLRKKFGTKQ